MEVQKDKQSWKIWSQESKKWGRSEQKCWEELDKFKCLEAKCREKPWKSLLMYYYVVPRPTLLISAKMLFGSQSLHAPLTKGSLDFYQVIMNFTSSNIFSGSLFDVESELLTVYFFWRDVRLQL